MTCIYEKYDTNKYRRIGNQNTFNRLNRERVRKGYTWFQTIELDYMWGQVIDDYGLSIIKDIEPNIPMLVECGLTVRESQVYAGLELGYDLSDIGRILDSSRKTLRQHRNKAEKRMYEVFGE